MPEESNAFVIMPFDEDFDSVYTHFIRPVLEAAGYQVERADDIASQQSILKDILNSIRQDDLIIADLTSLNPNVFYELGIAHALQKRVILLTQNIDEVPFDLKPYRLLEYSLNFMKIEEAKKTLKNFAEGARAGTLEFGNPVTDFIASNGSAARMPSTEKEGPQGESSESDMGFLDYQVAWMEGNERITEILNGVTAEMESYTQYVLGATEEIAVVNSNPNQYSPRTARGIMRQMAERVTKFNSSLSEANAEYSGVLLENEDALEAIVAFSLENQDTPEPEWNEFYSILYNFEATAAEARDACVTFAGNMDQVPKMEARLSRALARGSEELRTMAGNIDRTVASVARAKQRIEQERG